MGGLIVFWLLCGVVGGLMGTSKPKIGGAGGFFLGALLGPLGLLVILASKGHPDAPPPTALQRIQRRPEAVGQGWHPDPLGRFDSRWWDGNEWTQHVGRVGSDGTRAQFEDPV